MRSLAFTAILLFAVPVLAADAPLNAQPDAPPSPPPVTYSVWGFKWDGQQYVRQTTHSFSTTDIKQAQGYADQINSYAGWSATTNIPEPVVVHTVYHGPTISDARPSALPDKPTYSVWAFKLTNGKWVKDEQYSWTTTDPLLGLEYAQKVNAVPGWRATTNSPDPVPEAQRYVDGGTVHGAEAFTANNSRTIRIPSISIGGWTVYLPNMNIQIQPGTSEDVDTGSYDSTASDASWWNSIQDSINLQNTIATQDMINTQQMNNNIQDMLNTQNMFNTQNMIDSQNAINAQMGP